VFGVCMTIPTMTWALVAVRTSGVLGLIALTGSLLAAFSTVGAFMMRRWTAYTFALWALISQAWELGLRVAFGSLSPSRAMASLAALGLMWALAAVLYRQTARYEEEHPRLRDSIMW
jgi:hypothetical protein